MDSLTLPPRLTGSHHDTASLRCLEAGAETAFAHAVERLYDINRWRELNPAIQTDFLLCDASGTGVTRLPTVGDRIRIDVPGPGSPGGDGYDWVEITAMEEGESPVPFASLTLEPCPNPHKPGDEAAHFYARGATNTLVVRRVGQCLLAAAHGRNERPNTQDPPLIDRVRNRAVALAGKVGLGQVQWQDWADGLASVV